MGKVYLTAGIPQHSSPTLTTDMWCSNAVVCQICLGIGAGWRQEVAVAVWADKQIICHG